MTGVIPPSLSIVPSPYPICHIARRTSDELHPDTGNPVIVQYPPVIRMAQAISQIGRLRGSSELDYSPEFVNRVETDLHVSVANPAVYAPLDQILLFPEVDEVGDYVPGTGMAFVVDGIAYDGRSSPWPLFSKAMGGTLRVRRVT